MIRKALGFLFIGILVSGFFWGQTGLQAQEPESEQRKLSPDEVRAFNQFVEKFNQRLLETRDISFMFEDMVVSDYGGTVPSSELIQSEDNISGFLRTCPLIIRYQLFQEVSKAEVKEFAFATWNFMYLRHLIALGNSSFDEFSSTEGPPEKYFPKQVTAILKTKPYFTRFINYDVYPAAIKTVEDFREATKLLKEMESLLREAVKQSPPEQGKFYVKNIERYNQWGTDYNEPNPSINLDAAANVEFGENVIHATLIPSIGVGLVKRGNQFKIYYAQPYMWW